MEYDRYAIYWAPEPGSALAGLGATWLGWDAEARVETPAPAPDLIADPRRYGLHATLKAPFRGARPGLAQAVAALAARQAPVVAPGLVLTAEPGFAALVPGPPAPRCRPWRQLASPIWTAFAPRRPRPTGRGAGRWTGSSRPISSAGVTRMSLTSSSSTSP